MPKIKRGVSPYEQAMEDFNRYILMRSQAIEDFNLMIGNLADPSEGEEDEESEI